MLSTKSRLAIPSRYLNHLNSPPTTPSFLMPHLSVPLRSRTVCKKRATEHPRRSASPFLSILHSAIPPSCSPLSHLNLVIRQDFTSVHHNTDNFIPPPSTIQSKTPNPPPPFLPAHTLPKTYSTTPCNSQNKPVFHRTTRPP